MTRIVLADCAQHHIAIPTPSQPDDFACPHCRIKELEAQIKQLTEENICLTTEMPAGKRLINQRRTIKILQTKIETLEKGRD